jgi:integrase
MSRRAKATDTLLLEGGQWRPHDLRRTSATMMSRLGVATAVINLCLNHKPQDKLDRIYIRDDRMPDRMAAFASIGSHLERLTTPAA